MAGLSDGAWGGMIDTADPALVIASRRVCAACLLVGGQEWPGVEAWGGGASDDYDDTRQAQGERVEGVGATKRQRVGDPVLAFHPPSASDAASVLCVGGGCGCVVCIVWSKAAHSSSSSSSRGSCSTLLPCLDPFPRRVFLIKFHHLVVPHLQ